MMFTRQVGGGGKAKDDEILERAGQNDKQADNKVTFKDVAGLQEEKRRT